MDIHYCQGQIEGVSLLGKAKSCHEKQVDTPCHRTKKSCHHKQDSVSKTNRDDCCHNETVVVEKSDTDAAPTPLADVQDIALDFVAAFIAVYVLNYSEQADDNPYKHYDPPLPVRDVQVLYQTFLI